MRWQGGDESGNVEDRRGLGPVGVGGVGVGGLVLAAIGYFVFGISPQATLNAVNSAGPGGFEQPQQAGARGAPTDREGRFVDVIATSVDAVWRQEFQQMGRSYRPPAAEVLYDRATGTGCGLGQSAMGPFYCPQDQKVYLDLSFWQELDQRFGATGEAARAYVIAHEMGHHVQHLLGQDRAARALGAQGPTSGSVRLELQADCYAGVWAAHVADVTAARWRWIRRISRTACAPPPRSATTRYSRRDRARWRPTASPTARRRSVSAGSAAAPKAATRPPATPSAQPSSSASWPSCGPRLRRAPGPAAWAVPRS